MQPAVEVDRFDRLLRLMPVALHHDRPAYQQFAVTSHRDFDTGQRLPDRTDLVRAGSVGGPDAHALRQSPHFVDGNAQTPEEFERFDRSGRSTDYSPAQLFQAERVAQLSQHEA